MAIAGVFGVPLGLVVSFFLVEGFGALFPWIGAYFEGILVAAFNLGYPIKFWLENMLSVFGKIDLNFLAIVIFQGIGLGLSIGLKKVLKG
jgi:hypothetical protein